MTSKTADRDRRHRQTATRSNTGPRSIQLWATRLGQATDMDAVRARPASSCGGNPSHAHSRGRPEGFALKLRCDTFASTVLKQSIDVVTFGIARGSSRITPCGGQCGPTAGSAYLCGLTAVSLPRRFKSRLYGNRLAVASDLSHRCDPARSQRPIAPALFQEHVSIGLTLGRPEKHYSAAQTAISATAELVTQSTDWMARLPQPRIAKRRARPPGPPLAGV